MFPTASHPDKIDLEGLALMRVISKELTSLGLREGVRLIGVGGIDEGNCGDVMRAGADGVAVISALSAGSGTREKAERLRAALADPPPPKGVGPQ